MSLPVWMIDTIRTSGPTFSYWQESVRWWAWVMAVRARSVNLEKSICIPFYEQRETNPPMMAYGRI